MNELMNTTTQTPIEVALGIDENGMTTARKLYAFLGLRPDNFSRWCKANITENQFAEENTDYLRFVFCDETPTGGKIQREDYKLSASFAKKLSMMSKSEKGEQANAYNNKSLRATLYSDMHRQLKREFGVSTYKAIKRNQTDLAVQIIETYKPPLVIAERIESENAQENLFAG